MFKKNNANFFWGILNPFKYWIMLQSVAGIVWAIDLSFRPYLLKKIIDALGMGVNNSAINNLIFPLLLYISMSFLVLILFRLYDFCWIKIVSPMKARIVAILTNDVVLNSVVNNKNDFSGTMTNILNNIMNGVPEILKIIVDKFFTQLLAAGIAIATIATIGIYYSVALLVWLFAFVGGSIYFTKRLKNVCDNSHKFRNVVFNQVLEVFSNIITIRMFAASKFEATRMQLILKEFIYKETQRDMRFMIVAAFQGVSFIIYQAVCLIFLVIGFYNGKVSAGDFVLLLNVNIALIGMLRNFSNELLSLSNIISSVSQGLSIIFSENSFLDTSKAENMTGVTGKIVFDRVTFSYNNAPIFINKSITILSGQKVGLVGYSGSGKSTFINLILRLYNPSSGKITIDEYDISRVNLDSLRYHISIIPQDTILFNRTILENISYGTNAKFETVVAASKVALAHDFIMSLPNDYNTLVGTRGLSISGGQRQRIAIARAILKNSPIVILDEPTSQLDTITESFLQNSFLDLVKGKTTIVVAHRISTLVNMDRILVFDSGVIVEDGTHEQLLQLNGLYYRLCRGHS